MPEKFLKAVELSLREWGRDRFAMGTFAMDSPKEWYSIDLKWKKTECYIAFCRHFKKMKSYGKYFSFYWPDYTSRLRMRATFNNRHWPYSSGHATIRGLIDAWRTGSTGRKRKRKTSDNKVPAASSKSKKKGAATSSEEDLHWNSETEMWES